MRRSQRFTSPEDRAGRATSLLFVYGTLRRGAPMHGLIERRAVWLGAGRVAGRLLDLGAFPGMVAASAPGDRVVGELYAIAAADGVALLDALDRYEGASFERVCATVEGPEGPVDAWLYVYRGDSRGRPAVPGDDYLG